MTICRGRAIDYLAANKGVVVLAASLTSPAAVSEAAQATGQAAAQGPKMPHSARFTAFVPLAQGASSVAQVAAEAGGERRGAAAVSRDACLGLVTIPLTRTAVGETHRKEFGAKQVTPPVS